MGPIALALTGKRSPGRMDIAPPDTRTTWESPGNTDVDTDTVTEEVPA